MGNEILSTISQCGISDSGVSLSIIWGVIGGQRVKPLGQQPNPHGHQTQWPPP